MPRIYDGSNEPLDFCQRCFPRSEKAAKKRFGEGAGPDGRGNCFEYDADHPRYEEVGDYVCSTCGEVLTENDNDRQISKTPAKSGKET